MNGEGELREKLALIERQSATIRALATPIIQVWDEVLCLPVIGTVDSARTADMMQGLLDAIVREQARYAIVDLTGVEVVDTSTADHLSSSFARRACSASTASCAEFAPRSRRPWLRSASILARAHDALAARRAEVVHTRALARRDAPRSGEGDDAVSLDRVPIISLYSTLSSPSKGPSATRR